jgi:hypothetical protein
MSVETTIETKVCPKCGDDLPLTSFPLNKTRRDGRGSWCRLCTGDFSTEHYEKNKEKRKKQTTAARRKRVADGSTVERDYQRGYRRARRGTPLFEMRRRHHDAVKRAKKYGYACTITAHDLVALWEQQGGKCALSGLAMTLAQGQRDARAASVDRIDSSRGYEPGNVRLVTWMVNRARASWSDAELIEMCRGVVARLERQHG